MKEFLFLTVCSGISHNPVGLGTKKCFPGYLHHLQECASLNSQKEKVK